MPIGHIQEYGRFPVFKRMPDLISGAAVCRPAEMTSHFAINGKCLEHGIQNRRQHQGSNTGTIGEQHAVIRQIWPSQANGALPIDDRQ
jgi:hypothetical protein